MRFKGSTPAPRQKVYYDSSSQRANPNWKVNGVPPMRPPRTNNWHVPPPPIVPPSWNRTTFEIPRPAAPTPPWKAIPFESPSSAEARLVVPGAASGAPSQRRSQPEFLFHYTDDLGMRSIMEQRYIRTSIPAEINPTLGPLYGEGVYLTAIPPTTPDNVILLNNWNDDGLASSGYSPKGSKFAKLQYCFVIPTNMLSSWALEEIWDKLGRNIWVYRSGIILGENDVILRRRW